MAAATRPRRPPPNRRNRAVDLTRDREVTDALGQPYDRRRHILQVVFQLIVERGLEGLRFGSVARHAGINNGTLLYYFPSKEALIQGVVAYLLDEFSANEPPHPSEAPPDALAELRADLDDARRRLGGPLGTVYIELLARSQRDPDVAAALRAMDAAWTNWLTIILDRGRAQGIVRPDLDPELATTTIRAVTLGVGIQGRLDDPKAIDRAMSAVTALIESWLRRP